MRSTKQLLISIFVLLHAASRLGVERLTPDAAVLLSHAVQLRLHTLLEKLSVVAEHRSEVYRVINARFMYVDVCIVL